MEKARQHTVVARGTGMKCVHCNERVPFKAKFCGNCGTAAPARGRSETAVEAKEYASDLLAEGKVAAKEAAQLAKVGLKSDVGKSVAACAAIGAVVAVPIPFVGPILGAAIGAGIGLVRKIV
jgi:hypothetical protein